MAQVGCVQTSKQATPQQEESQEHRLETTVCTVIIIRNKKNALELNLK